MLKQYRNLSCLLMGLLTFGLHSSVGAQPSRRFPTDVEVTTLLQELKTRIRQNPKYIDRSRRDFSLETFTKAWTQFEPSASYFLGSWDSQEDDLMIYPTPVQGKVCVIWTVPAGRGNGRAVVDSTFNIGFVSNGQLKVNDIFFNRGKAVIIRDGNYLLTVSVYQNNPQISTYSGFSQPLQPIDSLPLANTAKNRKVIEQFNNAGCTASLPDKVFPQIPVVATYRNVREFGLAQLIEGDKKLTTAYETLVRASQGKYSIPVSTNDIDFLKKPIATLRPIDCQQLGFSCIEKEINFSDYLELKQKIVKQKEVLEDSMNIANQVNVYGQKLNNDTRYGGKNTVNLIAVSTKKIWDEAQSKARTKVNLSLSEKVNIVTIQTVYDTLEFSFSVFKTSVKALATIYQIDEIDNSIRVNTLAETIKMSTNSFNYIFSVLDSHKDLKEAFLKADGEKIHDTSLTIVQATFEYINLEENPKVGKSATILKVYRSAKDFIDQDRLLQQSQLLNNLDSFDKFYLYAAQMSKGLEIAIAGVSVPLSSGKADSLLKKVDAANIILFDALEFSYKNDFRRRYVRLLDAYNRNQFLIIGVKSYLDVISTEVGNYLINTRKDAVSRRLDGSVIVSTQGIIYPP